MSISNANVAAPAFYVSTAVAYGQANHVATHAAITPFQATVVPPGRSLGECVDFVFSDGFRKFINASREVPPVTVVGEIANYLSDCICKIYNTTFPPSKNELSSVVKDTPSNSTKPPNETNIYSITEIAPIFRNVSDYFFKVFIPYAEQKKKPGNEGMGQSYAIYLKQEFAKTVIGLNPTHYYAHESTPAMNVLSASVFCAKGRFQEEEARADSRIVDLIKNLSTTYFKKMGMKVYVNDRPI